MVGFSHVNAAAADGGAVANSHLFPPFPFRQLRPPTAFERFADIATFTVILTTLLLFGFGMPLMSAEKQPFCDTASEFPHLRDSSRGPSDCCDRDPRDSEALCRRAIKPPTPLGDAFFWIYMGIVTACLGPFMAIHAVRSVKPDFMINQLRPAHELYFE